MQYRRFVHVGRSCDQSLDDAPKCGVDSKFRDYSKRNHPTLSDSRLQRICKSQICGRAAMCMFRKESKHCGSPLPKTSTQSNECLAIDAQRHRHHKHPSFPAPAKHPVSRMHDTPALQCPMFAHFPRSPRSYPSIGPPHRHGPISPTCLSICLSSNHQKNKSMTICGHSARRFPSLV
jgi:hypothetical protein